MNILVSLFFSFCALFVGLLANAAFTVVGYSESQDNAAAYAEVAAIPDQHVHVEGDTIYIPPLCNLLGVMPFMGATVPGNVRMDSPSLRRVCLLDVSPILAVLLAQDTDIFEHQPMLPIKLSEGEGMKCMSNANPGSAEIHSTICLLSDGVPSPAQGEIFTVYATASITGVNSNWANGALTFSQDLPVGRYAIVGAVCLGANMVAFRFVTPGYSWRPGFTCNTAVDDRYPAVQRYGRLGKWCEFDSAVPPTIDVLVVDTCTAQCLYIDLMKIG